jgi:hypothetical protein
VPAADLGYMAAYQAGQLLGLVILAALAFWLLRRARRRSEQRYEELAPKPPTVSAIVAAAEPVAAKPVAAKPVAEPNGSPPEEAELREIYEKVGKPEALVEAKEKVVDLAAQLVERDGIEMDEALRTAYRRSLAEHREYLAAKGLA